MRTRGEPDGASLHLDVRSVPFVHGSPHSGAFRRRPSWSPLCPAHLRALLCGGSSSRRRARCQPDDGVTARNIAEVFVEMISGLAEGVIGHHSERYVPLLASFFVFILLANLIGLVPGLFAAHVRLQHHVRARARLVHRVPRLRDARARREVREAVSRARCSVLAPLMLVVELFSHVFRPVSLGIRLFANMFADHQVVEIFTGPHEGRRAGDLLLPRRASSPSCRRSSSRC